MVYICNAEFEDRNARCAQILVYNRIYMCKDLCPAVPVAHLQQVFGVEQLPDNARVLVFA